MPSLPRRCSNISLRISANQVSVSRFISAILWPSSRQRPPVYIDIIYIHRSWFAEALRDSTDPLQHEYGPSVIAVYRSANVLIKGMKSLLGAHSKAGRVWFFWSCFYTSSVRMHKLIRERPLTGCDVKVLLGAIVVKCPGCKLAGPALDLLNESFMVYEEGSKLCRPPATLVTFTCSKTSPFR